MLSNLTLFMTTTGLRQINRASLK